MVRSDGRCYTALVECAANFKGLVRGSLGFSACASCEKINFVLEINKEVRPGEPGCFFATCLRTDLHNAWYVVCAPDASTYRCCFNLYLRYDVKSIRLIDVAFMLVVSRSKALSVADDDDDGYAHHFFRCVTSSGQFVCVVCAITVLSDQRHHQHVQFPSRFFIPQRPGTNVFVIITHVIVVPRLMMAIIKDTSFFIRVIHQH